MPSWAIKSTNFQKQIKLNKMEETSKNNETAQLGIGAVISRLSLHIHNDIEDGAKWFKYHLYFGIKKVFTLCRKIDVCLLELLKMQGVFTKNTMVNIVSRSFLFKWLITNCGMVSWGLRADNISISTNFNTRKND